jgi:hypothetical protein
MEIYTLGFPAIKRNETNHGRHVRWVFIYRGRRLQDPRDGFKAAMKSAGYSENLFHHLRRTAIRNMEAAFIPRAEAMQISGHCTESVYKPYDISSERGAIRAGEIMAQHMRRLEEQSNEHSTNRAQTR